MIHSVMLVCFLGAAPASEPSSDKPPSPLERYASPIDKLSQATIGQASRAVRYDWRRMNVGASFQLTQILELNNFFTIGSGVAVRKPYGDFMLELSLLSVETWGSESTAKLALTPYRQGGRPSRWEVGLTGGFPLAEGVLTPRFSFLPASEWVFNVVAGARYVYYPGQSANMGFLEAVSTMFLPVLNEKELGNLDATRPPGMQIIDSRYFLLFGVSSDIYTHSGLFLTPRAMLGLPALSANTSSLGWWWELSMNLGWAF